MADTLGALPVAYAPFLPVLERLSEPLLHALHGPLLQFERLIRDFDAPALAPQGEFEGFGGLVSQGPIEHLVQSELLLRTEAPLEFLRRLSEAESLFLERNYADPGARSVYRAMISAGPGMLGHGRIVALAAILFLGRVAAQRGALFHWCALPNDEGAIWFSEVSVNTVKRFLRAAAFREMNEADRAEAEATWTRLAPDLVGAERVRAVDWVIGAAPRGRAAERPAIATATNALGFAFDPPIAGQPRSAVLALRQQRGERARVTVQMPDDRVCVSALNEPFRPMKPVVGAPAASAPIPQDQGWEPNYLVIPRSSVRILRTDEGVLILLRRDGDKGGFGETYLVTWPEGATLAGIRMQDNMLSAIVHRRDALGEILIYGQFLLVPKTKIRLGLNAAKRVASYHLFAKRARYALPWLNLGDGGAEFYSTSGQAYQLSLPAHGGEADFLPLYRAPVTLGSNGAYRLVKVKDGTATILRVVKNRAGKVDDYVTPILPQKMLAMVYSANERGLAYSVQPNVWRVPGPIGADVEEPNSSGKLQLGREGLVDSRSLVFTGFDKASLDRAPTMISRSRVGDIEVKLAPHETLISGKIGKDQAIVRIWSDARRGGDGTISIVHVQDGRRTQRHTAIKLGEDGLAIAKIEINEDGYWAVAVDGEGSPTHLLHYEPAKHSKSQRLSRYPIADLVNRATPIDLGQLHG